MQDESLVNKPLAASASSKPLDASGLTPSGSEADAQYAALDKWHQGFPYGDQWAMSSELRSLVVSWIQSAVPEPCDSVIVELGSGGGRWTHRLHRAASRLVAIDRGPASRREIERVYGRLERCTYLWPKGSGLPVVSDIDILHAAAGFFDSLPEGDQAPLELDYIFSYDTLVHFHPELFWATLKMLFSLGARVMHLHWGYSDVASQREAGKGCFWYYSLGEVMTLAGKYGYKLVRTHVVSDGFGSILGEFKHVKE